MARGSVQIGGRGTRIRALATGRFHEDQTAEEVEKLTANPGQFLLIEIGVSGGSYFTVHASMDDASDYRDAQEYPEYWHVERLVDLDSGQEYGPVVHTSWEQASTAMR